VHRPPPPIAAAEAEPCHKSAAIGVLVSRHRSVSLVADLTISVFGVPRNIMPRPLADLEADFNPGPLCHSCGTGLTAWIGTATDVELDALEVAISVARRRTDVVSNLPAELLPSVFRFLGISDVVREPPTFAHRIL